MSNYIGNLFKVKVTGSLRFYDEKSYLKKTMPKTAWFASPKAGIILPFILAAIDIGGFYQIVSSTLDQEDLISLVAICGFIVAFELAPLYIGYAICLKCYNLGEKIRGYVFGFSLFSFVLGNVANICLRLGTVSIAYSETPGVVSTELPVFAYPVTILFILLPISTSLVSGVIGCLTFDPLLADLKRIAKRIVVLKIEKRKIEAALKEYSIIKETEWIKERKAREEKEYNAVKDLIEAKGSELEFLAKIAFAEAKERLKNDEKDS